MVMMMVVIQWMCVVEGKQETTLFLRIFTRQSFNCKVVEVSRRTEDDDNIVID
jgi:hypothetical protein